MASVLPRLFDENIISAAVSKSCLNIVFSIAGCDGLTPSIRDTVRPLMLITACKTALAEHGAQFDLPYWPQRADFALHQQGRLKVRSRNAEEGIRPDVGGQPPPNMTN